MSDDKEKNFSEDYPIDLAAGKELISIYVWIIRYKDVGDPKSPPIWGNDSKERLKIGHSCEIKPTLKTFQKLEQKFAVNNFLVKWTSIADKLSEKRTIILILSFRRII